MSRPCYGGPGCTTCLEEGAGYGSLSFPGRDAAFAVFARLVETGHLPAMCESHDGTCRVCWSGPTDGSREA